MPTCANCGKPRPSYPATRKFCDDCSKIERHCETCGKSFFVPRNLSKHKGGLAGTFCSVKCMGKARDQGKNYHGVLTICVVCGKEFHNPNDYEVNQTCSKKCRYALAAKHASDTFRKHGRFSVTYNCEYCGKPTKVSHYQYSRSKHHFCSHQCHVESLAIVSLARDKAKSGHRTDLEIVVENFLIAIHIPYEFEYPMGRYSIDFAIQPIKLAIECDGKYWHSSKEWKRRDQEKDQFLREHGWTVLRLSDKAIKDGSFAIELSRIFRLHPDVALVQQ